MFDSCTRKGAPRSIPDSISFLGPPFPGKYAKSCMEDKKRRYHPHRADPASALNLSFWQSVVDYLVTFWLITESTVLIKSGVKDNSGQSFLLFLHLVHESIIRIYRDFTADMPTKPKGSNETIETAQKSSLQRNMFHYSLISVFAQTTENVVK